MLFRSILALKITVATLLILIVAVFFFRDTLLQQAITKVSHKMEQDYNSRFSVKKASFVGLSGLSFSNVILVPKNADTLFNIHKMNTSVNLWKLLVGDVQLGTLEIEKGYVQLTKKGKIRNFDAFLKKDSAEIKENSKRNYANFAYNIISRVLNLVPIDMKVQNLSFRLNDNGKKANINFKTLRLIDKQLETSFVMETSAFSQRLRIEGFADPRNKKADIRLFNIDTGAIKVPYLDERFNLKSSFDSIRINVQNIDKSGGELHIDGFASIANLMMNHKKIASKDVVIKNAKFDYRFLLGSDFISIDSSSTVQFNKIKFHPYLSYDTEKDTIYKLKIAIPKMKAQDFIVSLPDGLFTNFQRSEERRVGKECPV